MSRDIEAVIAELQTLLPYVARDAERYRNPTELVSKSHELHMAARAIDETLPHPSLASLAKGPFINVKIGTKAVEAIGLRKLPYDFFEASYESVKPGEEHKLLFKKEVSTDVFNPMHRQPIYGQMRYFDLATLGRILEEGGELSPTEVK